MAQRSLKQTGGLTLWGLLLVLVVAAPLLAGTLDRSLRPVSRGANAPEPVAVAGEEDVVSLPSALAVSASLRPEKRSAAIARQVEAVRQAARRGQVCDDPDIQGTAIGTHPGPGACGVQNAVKLRSILGVGLSQQAIMDCRTARALKSWIRSGAIPAIGNEGGGLAQLRVIGHYSCRTRNNQAGAKLSEHAFGRAIDIAGFTLRDGSEISVLRGWSTKSDGAQLRRMHRTACGIFGTVLGPDANAAHRDHFHFDTAAYRAGAYCR